MDWVDQVNALVNELTATHQSVVRAYQFNACAYTHDAHLASRRAPDLAKSIALIVQEQS